MYGFKKTIIFLTAMFFVAINVQAQSLKTLTRKAGEGNANAMNNLGKCYFDGTGIGQDFSKAFYWFGRSAEYGNADGCNNLAICYFEGKGTDMDKRKAVECWRKAADAGNVEAMFNIGLCYLEGTGTEQDDAMAEKYFQNAKIQGDRDAEIYLDRIEQKKIATRQLTEQVEYFIAKAQTGDTKAMDKLYQCYKEGRGVVKDGNRADMLQKASRFITEGKRNEAMKLIYEMFPPAFDVSAFTAFVKNYVEKEINEWQKKGEFEKTADWQARVNETTRNAKIENLIEKAKKVYVDDYVRRSPFAKLNLELKDYDADNEVYLVSDPLYGDMLVPVSIKEAPKFKKTWKNMILEPDYFIEKDRLALASLSFRMPDGKIYKYSNKASLSYTMAEINYNFAPVEIELADSEPTGGQIITTKNISIGKSDVDVNIPVNNIRNENTFAVIIANENYEQLSKVPYAINDSKSFSEYCNKTFGIPKANIRYYSDATYGKMLAAMDDIKQISKSYNGEIKVIFYYAGHGAPDEDGNRSYLIPTDAYRVNNRSCYALSDLYKDLASLNARSVAVFMDACFTGSTRSGNMLASARGIAIVPKKIVPQGNLLIFSAASKDETALPYTEKGHGLFTYFLLKKLQETKGDVTYGELADYLTTTVSRRSSVINKKSQTPTITPGTDCPLSWKSLFIK